MPDIIKPTSRRELNLPGVPGIGVISDVPPLMVRIGRVSDEQAPEKITYSDKQPDLS